MTTRKHDPSATTLTDGMVFTTRLSGGKSAATAFAVRPAAPLLARLAYPFQRSASVAPVVPLL
jgi:hypothetical protein